MAYRTSQPLHPTEFGGPDKKGTTGMKGTTGVRGSSTKTGVTGAVGTRGSGSGSKPKLQAFQTVKVPSSRTPHSMTGATNKATYRGKSHSGGDHSGCTFCNPQKKKMEKLAYPPKAKKLSYSIKPNIAPKKAAPKKTAPKKAAPKKTAPKKYVKYTKGGKVVGTSKYSQGDARKGKEENFYLDKR